MNMRFRVYINDWYYGKLYVTDYGHFFIHRSSSLIHPGYGGSVPELNNIENLELLRVQ